MASSKDNSKKFSTTMFKASATPATGPNYNKMMG
jgi:hypothetical protein